MKSGFQKAYSLLNSGTGTGCSKYIIFISDDYYWDSDAFEIGSSVYTVCDQECDDQDPPHCRQVCRDYCTAPQSAGGWNTDVVNYVKSRASQARVFGYTVSDYLHSERSARSKYLDSGSSTMLTELTQKLACETDGQQRWTADHREPFKHTTPRMHMRETYLKTLQMTSGVRQGQVSFSSLYLDNMGLGLLVSLVVPVYNAHGGANAHMVGAVGTDVRISDFSQLIRDAFPHDVDAFLVDDRGKAVMHPRLLEASELTSDPILVGIKDLEQNKGVPVAFDQIVTAMRAGSTGYKVINDTQRFLPAGDVLDGVVWVPGNRHYYYGHIAQSTYSFAFNLGDHDLSYQEPELPVRICATNDACFSETAVYHQIQEVQSGSSGSVDLSITSNQLPFGIEPVAKGYLSFKLAPKAFCNPVAYIDQTAAIPHAFDIHTTFNADTPLVAPDPGPSGPATAPLRTFELPTHC